MTEISEYTVSQMKDVESHELPLFTQKIRKFISDITNDFLKYETNFESHLVAITREAMKSKRREIRDNIISIYSKNELMILGYQVLGVESLVDGESISYKTSITPEEAELIGIEELLRRNQNAVKAAGNDAAGAIKESKESYIEGAWQEMYGTFVLVNGNVARYIKYDGIINKENIENLLRIIIILSHKTNLENPFLRMQDYAIRIGFNVKDANKILAQLEIDFLNKINYDLH